MGAREWTIASLGRTMLRWLFPEEPPQCVCGYFGNEGTIDRHLAHQNNQNRTHHRLVGSSEAAPLTKCPINCPQGHPLQPFFTPGDRCDGSSCSVYCSKGTPVLDCRACNWYLCIACQSIITRQREHQGSKLPLQIPRAEADEPVKQAAAHQRDQQPLASQLRQRVVPRTKEGSDLPHLQRVDQAVVAGDDLSSVQAAVEKKEAARNRLAERAAKARGEGARKPMQGSLSHDTSAAQTEI